MAQPKDAKFGGRCGGTLECRTRKNLSDNGRWYPDVEIGPAVLSPTQIKRMIRWLERALTWQQEGDEDAS